jgi:predicted O-methyltransferase YrrM
MPASKPLLLLSRPNEAWDRIRIKLHSWAEKNPEPSRITDIAESIQLPAKALALFGQVPGRTGEISRIRRRIEAQQAELVGPFGSFHNGTATLGELCYLACRCLRPRVVVETGVAYGVTSAYILQALTDNGHGELHSIDLPPLAEGADSYVGHFVPHELRARWNLHIGPASRLLPDILREANTIDVFVHDSLHTYSHMKWEFERALLSLRPGGALISDDIEGNRAFEEATRHPSVASWFAVRQADKDAMCGALRMKA